MNWHQRLKKKKHFFVLKAKYIRLMFSHADESHFIWYFSQSLSEASLQQNLNSFIKKHNSSQAFRITIRSARTYSVNKAERKSVVRLSHYLFSTTRAGCAGEWRVSGFSSFLQLCFYLDAYEHLISCNVARHVDHDLDFLAPLLPL